MKFQFLLASLFAWDANGLEKSESMDQPFQASTFKHLQHSPCVGLYYRNGRAGCGTVDRDIQSGPLHYHEGQTPPQDSAYVAVLEEYRFTSKIISNLMSNSGGLLQGILVLNGTITGSDETYLSDDMNTVASPGPIYPLGYSTPSANIAYGNTQYPWNGNGDGLNQYDLYGVPIVYVNEEGASAYIRSYSQNQQTNDTNQIFTDFTYYMGPDGIASKECLTWQDTQNDKWNPKCLPLGGTSVWGFAGSPPTQQVYKYQQDDAADADAADDNGNGRNLANNNKNNANVYQSQKAAIIVGTSIDSTSMFHDLAPGANEGASNTLTLLMAAYLLGQSVDDATLDALTNRIVFGFFEGEAYGYLGSRSFLNDVLNFSCDNQNLVNSVAKNGNSELACLYPMRPSMKFKDIGEIAGVLTVDQVGVPADDEILYVHNDGNGDFGTFLANVLKASGTNDFVVADSEAANNNDNGGDYPYPPTAFNALQGISGGAYSGAVLTGYDYVFTKRPPYQSHLNWAINSEINLKSIASAATLVARTALAAAYDDGTYDYETASNYAVNTIGELAYNDEVLVELANCLLVNGNCEMLNKYASQEAKNERDRTGFDIGSGASLGYPPNYYVGVYSVDYGQPFVRVGDKVYGSYNDGGKYGAKGNDAVGMQPRMLQQAIRNMLHDFLGRGQINGNAQKCSKESDCDGVAYCATEGDSATCSAKSVCVCKRAYYHIALDTSLTPAANVEPGFFSLDYDDGKTPIWTEPFWSSSVGVKMYRDSASGPGFIALGAGVVLALLMFNFTKKVKSGLQKEKVY
jgi:nicastrin